MKIKNTILSIALLCFAATSLVRAESAIQPIANKTPLVNTNVNIASATNVVSSLNEAVASILMSGKAVGSDIYGASKIAITDSINFVSAQAPDIIKQFLEWRMIEASTYAFVFLFVSIIFWYFGCRLRKFSSSLKSNYQDKDVKSAAFAVSWILTIVGFVPFILGTVSWLLDIAKIYFVPKIYLLDYICTLVRRS